MGAWDSFRNFFVVNDEYDEEEYNGYDEEEMNSQEERASSLRPKFLSTNNDNIRKLENSYTSKDVKVVIYEPTEYGEAQNIVDSLKNKRIVVVNFANMKPCPEEGKSADECRKEIFDFINGAIYAIEGNVQKMSSTIFVMAPPNVDIDSNIKQELDKKGSHRWAI